MPLYVNQYAIQSDLRFAILQKKIMGAGTRGSMTQLLERTTARHIHLHPESPS